MRISMLVMAALASMICCGIFFLSPGALASTLSVQGPLLDGVTYMNSETKPDPALESAFSKEFALKRGEDKVRYYYNEIDLNGDGVPETFVYLTGPILCGTGGCSGLVLECANGGYKVKSRFSLVRTPVFVSDSKTNGWKDIIMFVAGGGIEPGYRILRFDGKTYPLNPSIQPEVEPSSINGIGLINDDKTKNPGIEF